MQLFGQPPTGDVLFVACDSIYFHDHGTALTYSANEAGNALHIHLINPTAIDQTLADTLTKNTSIPLTFSGEETDLSNIDATTYYACARFLRAEDILRMIPVLRLMVIDIDSLVMRRVEFPDAPLGLFFRDDEPDHMRVAAGIVYLTKSSLNFITRVARIIQEHKLRWFIDQAALFKCSQEESNIYRLPKEYLDWEFLEDTVIWTGKGDRKVRDAKYMAMKDHYQRLSGVE